MRRLLAQQMDEKKAREASEKADNDQQAEIWRKDKENYELEEARLSNKIKQINIDNQTFLQDQMGRKTTKQNNRRMDKQEFLYNKGLLKEINEKKKSSVAGSQVGDQVSRVGSQFWIESDWAPTDN